jgi:hypothetical protein
LASRGPLLPRLEDTSEVVMRAPVTFLLFSVIPQMIREVQGGTDPRSRRPRASSRFDGHRRESGHHRVYPGDGEG